MAKRKHYNYRLIIEHNPEPITEAEDKKINEALKRVYEFCKQVENHYIETDKK